MKNAAGNLLLESLFLVGFLTLFVPAALSIVYLSFLHYWTGHLANEALLCATYQTPQRCVRTAEEKLRKTTAFTSFHFFMAKNQKLIRQDLRWEFLGRKFSHHKQLKLPVTSESL